MTSQRGVADVGWCRRGAESRSLVTDALHPGLSVNVRPLPKPFGRRRTWWSVGDRQEEGMGEGGTQLQMTGTELEVTAAEGGEQPRLTGNEPGVLMEEGGTQP